MSCVGWIEKENVLFTTAMVLSADDLDYAASTKYSVIGSVPQSLPPMLGVEWLKGGWGEIRIDAEGGVASVKRRYEQPTNR